MHKANFYAQQFLHFLFSKCVILSNKKTESLKKKKTHRSMKTSANAEIMKSIEMNQHLYGQ